MAVIVETENFHGTVIDNVTLTPSRFRVCTLAVSIIIVHALFIVGYVYGKQLDQPFDKIAKMCIITFWVIHLWITLLFVYRLINNKRILRVRANLLDASGFTIPIEKIKEITILGDSVFFKEYTRVKVLAPFKVVKCTYTYGFVSSKELNDFIQEYVLKQNPFIIVKHGSVE